MSKVSDFQVQHILKLEGESSCLKEPPDLYYINNLISLSYVMKIRSEIHFKTALSKFSMRGFLCLVQGELKKNQTKNLAPTIAHLKNENETTDVVIHRNDHFEAFFEVLKYYTNINTNNISWLQNVLLISPFRKQGDEQEPEKLHTLNMKR